MTVSGAQTTFNNPVTFGSAGDVSMAYDLLMTNGTAGSIKFSGPGYIMTDSVIDDLNLTFSAANLGVVIVDDTLMVTGTTTLADLLYINPYTGHVGIGTATPQSELSVAGDLQLAGSDNYLNFSDGVGTSSYGFRDNGGTLQFKNSGGQWVNIGSAGSGGALGSMSDVVISGAAYGNMLYNDAGTWRNSGLITLDAINSYVGIGTTTPSYTLDVLASTTDYLARIYNTSTGTSSGLYVRVDGSGNLLNLNYNGDDVMTVSGAQTTFNNPVTFGSAGDVSIANDLLMTNDTAGNIVFSGPGVIKTQSGYENLNLTLSAANQGAIIIDDMLSIASSTALENQMPLLFRELAANGTNYVGLKASSTLGGDYVWVLPATQGSANQAMLLDAAGHLAWSNVGSGTVASGTAGWIPYYAGYGDSLTATSSLYIASDGNIGVGTTTLSAKLTLDGNLLVGGDSRYLNFGYESGTSSYGFRDNGGTMQYKNQGGLWVNIGSAGGGGLIGSMSDVTITSAQDGQMLYYDSGTWKNSGLITLDADNGKVGIGTTTPLSALTLGGDLLLGSSSAEKYINFGYTSGTSSYGFRDNSGTLQFKNSGGQWVDIGSAGSSGALGSMSDVTVSDPAYGDLLMYNGGTWENVATGTLGLMSADVTAGLSDNHLAVWNITSGVFEDSLFSDTGAYVGLGTATPAALLHLSSTGGYDLFRVDDETGDASPFIIDWNGNVMIGTTTAGSKLTIMSDTGSQLRLSYDADTYANFMVNSAGELTIDSTGSSGSILQIGDGSAEDAGIVIDGNVYDFWFALDDTTNSFHIGTSTTIGSSSILTIMNSGHVGIGTSTPQSELSVAGDLQLAGSDNYLNFSDGVGTSSYGFRDNSGTLQFKNSGGQWVNIGSAGSAGDLGSMSGVSISSPQWGDLLMYNGTDWINNATSSLGLPMGSGVAGQLAVWSDHDTLEASNTLMMAYGGTGKQLSPVLGGLVYTDANSMEVLGAGVAGHILMSGGAAAPQWVSTSTFLVDSDFGANGLMVRTAGGTYANRTLTGTANQIDISNGDGVSGNPTFSLPSAVYLGSSGVIGRDADNLVDFSNDNQMVFRTNAADQMYLDSLGRLSLGTSTAASMLSIMSDAYSQLRLSYDTDTYVDFNVDATGQLNINSATTSIGIGSEVMRITGGRVGIGTATPQSELSVAGDLQLAGSDNYLNFSDGVGTSSYGFRDNGGTLQFKNSGGQWVNIGSAGSGGDLGSMSDVSISGANDGELLYNDSGTWRNSGLITLDADNSFVGIGTTTPSYTLDVLASTTDYLARIYNTSTGTSSGLYVRVDGSGNLLNLNYNGDDVMTVSGAQTTFNNPVTFGSAGDVAMAYDLLMTNGTAGNIIFSGPGVIKTNSTYENLDLTLSAANLGEVIVDDVLTVSGTTTLADLLYINPYTGHVGIGTSTPQSELSVAGDLQLAGADNYLNFSDGVGTTSYGFRDSGGTMQYKNSGGQWVNIGSAGSGGALGSMSDVNISSAQDGQMLYNDAGTWRNSGLITLDAINNYVGIGTSGPSYTLDVLASTTDYLARIYNTSTGTSSGLYVRVDGSGQLLTLNAGGNDIVTISEAASVFNNPVTFGSVGDVSMANDLVMTNDTAAYLTFQGPGYIRTDSASQNLNLTLSAANAGKVVVDDKLYITGSTTIYKADGSASDVMFQISTSTGIGFKIMGDGEAISDKAFNSGGADYAEYFYSEDNDLMPGEVVCVDITHNNAVKRCDRGEDGNVMGIVSTNPAIVGNNRADYRDNVNYAIIGMLGQVDAKVSAENGPIRPGDSLTSASTTPGLAMRAEAGDPTVGVALEGLDTGTGEIKVLISRRNKSLTVEMVEQQITERIAGMEIEDEVAIMLQKAIDGYNIASSVEPIVNDQMASFSQGLTVAMDDMSGQLVTLAAGVDDVLARITALESDMAGIYSYQLSMFNKLSMIDAKLDNLGSTTDSALAAGRIELTRDGNIVITNDNDLAAEIASESQATSTATSTEPDVAVVEIATAPETEITAFVVNQVGDADVADFQADGVSIVNIADSGRVTVVGELAVDGRLMVCSGGACGSTLDNAVDETMGDIGVEGKVVAGAFEGYCEDGYAWVPGSAKYGTLPGFCIETDEHGLDTDEHGSRIVWVNVSQGEASLACQGIGDGYHLVTENEWMTIAENVIRTADNDCEEYLDGLQLMVQGDPDATSSPIWATTSPIALALSNGNTIYGLVGGVSEWTDRTVTTAGLLTPVTANWIEYNDISDYRGYDIAPPYYYSSENGIGRYRAGENGISLRGFVRGTSALYDLDCSYSPTTATSTIGFRCAK